MRYRNAAILRDTWLGGMFGRATTKLTLGVFLLGASFAAGQASHTCKFTRGPLQGQTHTLPNRGAWAVGATCTDGLTSSGFAVPDSAPTSERTSHTCKFTHGALQGQTHTLPNREATPVGSTCSDGLTSSGIAVPDPETPESSERMSHTCRFTRGPLQGQTQTLANRSATAIGSTCSDGLTSSGVTVPDPDGGTSSERTTHTCRFRRGPLQGETRTLPNHNAWTVGSTCSDGLTSSGVAVPDPS